MSDPTPLRADEIHKQTEEALAQLLWKQEELIRQGHFNVVADNALYFVIHTLTVQEFAALKAAYGQEK